MSVYHFCLARDIRKSEGTDLARYCGFIDLKSRRISCADDYKLIREELRKIAGIPEGENFTILSLSLISN